MQKVYDRIDFSNNAAPALNETNLNAMSKGLDDLDNRVLELANGVLEVLPQLRSYLDNSTDLITALETLSTHPPYIGANGNWYVWNTATSQFVDSEVDASITVNIADITIIDYDQSPRITNTGTNTDPIFHLYLPRAAGVESIEKTRTENNVDTYTITFEDGFTSTFQITNGIGSSLSAMPDTNIVAPTAGQILIYNATTHKWENETIDLSSRMKTDGSNASNHVTLSGALTVGDRVAESAIGTNSVSEGSGNKATGNYSHAEGSNAYALGNQSHAEGYTTCAASNYSHAEGMETKATQIAAHAEGRGTTASGFYSHAQGLESHAETNSSMAMGQHGHTYTMQNELLSDTKKVMFAIGSEVKAINKEIASPSNQEATKNENCFSVDDKGNVYMRGAPYVVNGCIKGKLIATPDKITLEDGAIYQLHTHTRLNTGAYRGMFSYIISAPFNPSDEGLGTTTTAQALPNIANLASAGTVGCNLSRLAEAYTNKDGGTSYHAVIGIGSCATNCYVRYTLAKVSGSNEDFGRNWSE